MVFGTIRSGMTNHLVNVTDTPSDSDLVGLMALGDRQAFAALFRRHQGTVFRFSRQMLGSKEAAEDVTQEVFIALARRAQGFNPAIGSLTTYLYGIARNLILQRHKRSRAHLEVDIDTIDIEQTSAFSTAADPADEISRAQMVDQVRLAILRLPVRYREAIVLCELSNLSYEDAAAVVGCPVGTIRSRLSRARQILIERCRALLIPDHAGGKGQAENRERRAESGEQRAAGSGQRNKGGEKWLILTKNNC